MDMNEATSTGAEQFSIVAKAIERLSAEARVTPDLEALAEYVGLSPFHFQRLFVQWAGVSPKEFAQHLNLQRVKAKLLDGSSVYDAALEVGLSSGSRLHDLMISLESIAPGEFKRAGEGVVVTWGMFESPFGPAYLARTERGIVRLSFVADVETALGELTEFLPKATFVQDEAAIREDVDEIMSRMAGAAPRRTLGVLLSGSEFRIHVWRALLSIPWGSVVAYQGLAERAGVPKATRAVASGVAANPVAFLIPCHRVIQSTGRLGEYHWGSARKSLMVVREMAG